MWGKWIGYLFALLGAGVFYLFFEGWFSAFLLLLLAALPLFGLLVSLPGMLSCRLELKVARRQVQRGEEGRLLLTMSSRLALPVGRLAAVAEAVNLVTGERRTIKRSFFGGSLGQTEEAELPTSHCGEVVCRVKRLWVSDLLGLFALPVKKPPQAAVTVCPVRLPEEPIPALMEQEGDQTAMRVLPGGGPGEDYQLRSYRPGDSMRLVHWKLSSKLSELVVRETLERLRTVALLTYDHFGPPERLDETLDRLNAISRALLHREVEHFVAFEAGGEPRVFRIGSSRQLEQCLWAALCTKAPETGESLRERRVRLSETDGRVVQYHVIPSREEEGGEDG